MRRRSAVLVGGAAMLAGVGLCASVLMVGLWLCWPARGELGGVPGVLGGAEAVVFRSGSGSALRGWYLAPGRVGDGVVVLAHGIHTDRRSMVRRAARLHEQGFGALLFDLQAEGESPGRFITMGSLESLDVAAAVGFVRGRAPGERVGALGASLGGAAILLSGVTVDAVVVESVFPTLDSALRNRLWTELGPLGWVTPALAPVFGAFMPVILGVGMDAVRPIERIGGVGAPVLVMSGTADVRTPIAEARAMFERAVEPKSFWAVAGAGHVDLEAFDPKGYWGVVMPFLMERLQVSGAGGISPRPPGP